MPRIKLTKSAIDALPTPSSDVVYWDAAYPGFGVKITPKGRKVFIVLYRTGGAGSYLRKYTIGPYGRVTLYQARVAHGRQGWNSERHENPCAQSQTEMERRKSHRSRHYFHRRPGTGLLLRRPRWSVTEYADGFGLGPGSFDLWRALRETVECARKLDKI
jgi:hypothetical protein